MKLVCAIVREEKGADLIAALEAAGISGFTMSKASGRGRMPLVTVWRGCKVKTARPMCVLDVIVPDNQAEDIARLMIDAGRTGRSGDGHVFITAIESSYAIKSGWMEGV